MHRKIFSQLCVGLLLSFALLAQAEGGNPCFIEFQYDFMQPSAWDPFRPLLREWLSSPKPAPYLILDTDSWFSEEEFIRYQSSMTQGKAFKAEKRRKGFRYIVEPPVNSSFFLDFGEAFSQFINDELKELIGKSVPLERHTLWVADRSTTLYQGWHMDAEVYFTAVVYPMGKGLLFEEKGKRKRVPRGKLILFNGDQRCREFPGLECLYHSSSPDMEDKITAAYFFKAEKATTE